MFIDSLFEDHTIFDIYNLIKENIFLIFSSFYTMDRFNNYTMLSEILGMDVSFFFIKNNFMFALLLSSFFILISYSINFIRINYSNYFILHNYRLLFSLLYNQMMIPFMGSRGKTFLSFLLYPFIFLLCANYLGLLPNFFPPTSQLSVTFFPSSICWTTIFYVGSYIYGSRFFASFFPSKVPTMISPFLMNIEFISYIVRLASLSLRSFANIVAGHILSDTISLFFFYSNISMFASPNYIVLYYSMYILILLCAMLISESMIATLQAYILVILVIIYMKDSIILHV